MPDSYAAGEQPVLTMVGDIDIASEDQWRDRGVHLLEAHPDVRSVLVDMRGVGFLDSRGMAVLVDLHARSLERGGKLTLRAVPQRVLRALSSAGLDQIFVLESD